MSTTEAHIVSNYLILQISVQVKGDLLICYSNVAVLIVILFQFWLAKLYVH